MKNYCLTLFIISSALLLTACASATKNGVSTSNQLNQQDVLAGLETLRSSASYTLQPGDLIEIQVFKEEDI